MRQNRRPWRRLTAVLLAVFLCAGTLPGAAFAVQAPVDAYTGDIVLFQSNDMHSNLGPSKKMAADGSTYTIGGVARMAAALAQERPKAEGRTLTLDGGDFSQGTPYQDGYQQGWEILAMAAMGVQYTTLGNHEFDVGDQAIENSWVNAEANRTAFGVENELPQLITSNMFIKYDENGAVIEYTEEDIDPADLSTNAFASGEYAETGAVNYAVTEVNGYKVGLFGLEGEESYGYCKNSDLTRMDSPTTAKIYAQYLKEVEGCDLVIAISHCGDSEDQAIAQAAGGYLDVIQSAHSHTLYPQPETVNGVIIYSTGQYAQHLGILSLKKTDAGWEWVPGESRAIELNDDYDLSGQDPSSSAAAAAYHEVDSLVKSYDQQLMAEGGYYSKLGLTGVSSDTVVMEVPVGCNYAPGPGYTFVQSPLTAFIGDAFNYASGSQVSFFFGGYVRASLYQGDFTVADAFNIQSTGESALDHSAGASLIVCTLSGKQLEAICYFDAMCSGAVGEEPYGAAGTLHSSNMRYEFDITNGTISCDLDTIEIYDPETGTWAPVDPDKGYLCSFTFESTQNLVGYMPMLTGLLGYGSIPFAPYDEATGTYANVPADNTSDEYYAFWAPYCQGVGILEGTDYELKAWTALYYYADSMGGTLDDHYTVENVTPTRIRETYTVDGTADAGSTVTLTKADGTQVTATASADGSYTIQVPNGSYVLSTTQDGAAVTQSVELSMATVTAQAGDCAVSVNGEPAQIAVYMINGNPYLKLRDVAAAVSGTEAAFEVSWDGAANRIVLVGGQDYTVVGGEGVPASGTAKYINLSPSVIELDGEEISLVLYTIHDNNYGALSSFEALGIQAEWDAQNNTVAITTAA